MAYALSLTVYLIFLTPFVFVATLFGIVAFGVQKPILIRHKEMGMVKTAYFGWSWSYQLFGWFVPVFRGEIQIALLHLLLTMLTLGVFQFVMAFLYNKQYLSRLLSSGWILADTDENNLLASKKLGIG